MQEHRDYDQQATLCNDHNFPVPVMLIVFQVERTVQRLKSFELVNTKAQVDTARWAT